MDTWILTDPEVRRVIQERIGCGIDQAEDIIRQSMPIESLDEIYEMFLENIDVDEIQDDVFENIIVKISGFSPPPVRVLETTNPV